MWIDIQHAKCFIYRKMFNSLNNLNQSLLDLPLWSFKKRFCSESHLICKAAAVGVQLKKKSLHCLVFVHKSSAKCPLVFYIISTRFPSRQLINVFPTGDTSNKLKLKRVAQTVKPPSTIIPRSISEINKCLCLFVGVCMCVYWFSSFWWSFSIGSRNLDLNWWKLLIWTLTSYWWEVMLMRIYASLWLNRQSWNLSAESPIIEKVIKRNGKGFLWWTCQVFVFVSSLLSKI